MDLFSVIYIAEDDNLIPALLSDQYNQRLQLHLISFPFPLPATSNTPSRLHPRTRSMAGPRRYSRRNAQKKSYEVIHLDFFKAVDDTAAREVRRAHPGMGTNTAEIPAATQPASASSVGNNATSPSGCVTSICSRIGYILIEFITDLPPLLPALRLQTRPMVQQEIAPHPPPTPHRRRRCITKIVDSDEEAYFRSSCREITSNQQLQFDMLPLPILLLGTQDLLLSDNTHLLPTLLLDTQDRLFGSSMSFTRRSRLIL